MPSWKKIITSGSNAVLNTVTASFYTGSFRGDGSQLTGIVASIPNSVITTGSTTATQSITGSLIISGSGLQVTGSISTSNQLNVAGPAVANMSASIWDRMQITSGALEIVGGTRANALNISTAINAGLALNVTNTNTGSSAASQIALFNSTGSFAQLYMPSPTNASAGAAGASRFMIRTNGIRGMLIQSESGSIDIGVDGDRTILSVTTSSITATEVTASTMVVSNTAVRISGSAVVTGSLVVSGSSTFINIGPALFTGSIGLSGSSVTTGSVRITGSLFVNGTQIVPLNTSSFILVGDYTSNQTINGSLTQGYLNTAAGPFTTALGSGSIAIGTGSYSEGNLTIAGGNGAHAEGYGTVTGVVSGGSAGSKTEYFNGESLDDITSIIQNQNIWYFFDNGFTTTGLVLRAYDTQTNVAFFNGISEQTFDTMSQQIANAQLQTYVDSTSSDLYGPIQLASATELLVTGDVTAYFNTGDSVKVINNTVGDGLGYTFQCTVTTTPRYTSGTNQTSIEVDTPILPPYENVSYIINDTNVNHITAIQFYNPENTVVVNQTQLNLAGQTVQVLQGSTYYSATFGPNYAVSASTTYYTVTTTATNFTNILLNVASADYAHAEGYQTTALGLASHAEGYQTTTYAAYSHAGGLGTVASGAAQTAIGRYNVLDSESLFIVGGGTDGSNRSNLFTVDSSRTTIGNGLTLKSNYTQSGGAVNLSLSSSLFYVGNGVHTVVLPPTSTVPKGSIFYIKADPESGTGRFAITSSGGDYIDLGGRTKYAITASGGEKPCIQLAVGTPGYWGLLSVWNGVTSSTYIP